MNDPMRNPGELFNFDALVKKLETVTEPRWSREERLQQMISDFSPNFEEAISLLGVIFGRDFELGKCSDSQWDIVEEALGDFTRRLEKAADLHPEPPERDDDPE